MFDLILRPFGRVNLFYKLQWNFECEKSEFSSSYIVVKNVRSMRKSKLSIQYIISLKNSRMETTENEF